VGYRGGNSLTAQPSIPFGHGLGFTEWRYVSAVAPGQVAQGVDFEVEVVLENIGPRPGVEVVQVYLSRCDSAIERPSLWLAGFCKVSGGPGETVSARVKIASRALRHWSSEIQSWVGEPGLFDISIGRSSESLLLMRQVRLLEGRVDR
jgi:beta-glucosidase